MKLILYTILISLCSSLFSQSVDTTSQWCEAYPSSNIIRRDTSVIRHKYIGLISYLGNDFEGYLQYSILEVRDLRNKQEKPYYISREYRVIIKDIAISDFSNRAIFCPDATYKGKPIVLVQAYQCGASHVALQYLIFIAEPLSYKGMIKYYWWQHDEDWFTQELEALLEQ